jgi:Holliday junction resolvase RusA-like endonuclease
MTAMTFDIALNPIPLGRPQFVRRGRAHVAITPARSVEWRKAFRTIMAGLLPREPIEGPIRLEVTFARRCRSVMHRGDLTNLVKAVEDACNPDAKIHWPGLWRDDRQIEELAASIEEYGPAIPGRVLMRVEQLTPALAVVT